MPKLLLRGVVFYIIISQQVYAQDGHFDQGFNAGINSSTQLQCSATNALNNFKPNTVFENYTNNPKEANYATQPDAIKQDAICAKDQSAAGKSITESIYNHPEFNISADSKEMQDIQKRGDDAYSVISGQFGDCTKKTTCTTTYQTKTCQETPKSLYQYCKRNLNIDLNPKKVTTHYPFTIHLKSREHDYAGTVLNLENGKIEALQPHDASVELTGRLPSHPQCIDVSGSITKMISANPKTQVDILIYPSGPGSVLDLHVSNQGRQGTVDIILKIDIAIMEMKMEPVDHWEDECLALANNKHCVLKAERCVDTKSTHTIHGVPVTRDCWEFEDTFLCGAMETSSQCEDYRKEGCEQIGSICQSRDDSGCELFSQTFRCPIKNCVDEGLICNGETYCLNGDCVKQQKNPDPDFQRTVSALSAVNDAAKSFAGFNSIFGGEKKTCDKLALGFLNCCSDSGWGKDHIVSCSSEEKDLRKAKEKLLTVYVGEYCKKDVFGMCLEKRKAYCVFPSKLARIIQEHGRKEQLNISFGDPEKADCRGLTREEFADLDLSKIDFSDFYTDISQKEKIEDPTKVDSRLQDKITQWDQGKKPHG